MNEFKDFSIKSKKSHEIKSNDNFIQSERINTFERIQKSQKNRLDVNHIIEFRDRNSNHGKK